MQDLCILGSEAFFFLSTLLGVSRQGISSSISFALSIINPEVVPWQLLSLPDLFRTQAFRIHEILEVVVVCKYKNFMLVALQVMSPSLESFNDGQQLAVVDLKLSLCQKHLSWEKGYRMPLARIIQGQLTENLANSIARSIRLNSDMTIWIEMI